MIINHSMLDEILRKLRPTSLSVDGVHQDSYNLDTTSPTAADVGAYTTTETDNLIAAAVTDMVTIGGTQDLTNKTLTSPRINLIKDTNGNNALAINALASAVNYLVLSNSSAGSELQIAASGSDTNIGIWLVPKGSDPVVVRAPSGITPTLASSSPDTNADLNLASQGSGVVRANGGEIPTLNNSKTFTSKTINLSNNTIIGTLSQFNTALSDADFVSTSGAEVLSNKTLTAPKISGGSGTATITAGTGTPEGVETATVGSLFVRTDGGAATTLYVKETGTGNTGWVAK